LKVNEYYRGFSTTMWVLKNSMPGPTLCWE
jgi:hypothetical protein